LFELTVGRPAGSEVHLFNGSYWKANSRRADGGRLRRVERSRSSSSFKMIQPQFELLPDASATPRRGCSSGRITPVYESLVARAGFALAAQRHLPSAGRPVGHEAEHQSGTSLARIWRRRAECFRAR